jgi:hypothetical protein
VSKPEAVARGAPGVKPGIPYSFAPNMLVTSPEVMTPICAAVVDDDSDGLCNCLLSWSPPVR